MNSSTRWIGYCSDSLSYCLYHHIDKWYNVEDDEARATRKDEACDTMYCIRYGRYIIEF